MLLSWCLFTLPHLWYAHHAARALSDSPRQRQIKHDSVITSYGTTNFSSPAISEAQHLPRHDRPAVTAESAKQYVKETRGNSDTLSVDHDNSRTDDIPIKLNNNNEFDSERTNRNDDVRIQNSGNDALAIENHGFASDENISSEGRGHDVVANSRQDVPTNSRNVILVTGNSGLDFVSGDKNRKDFPNNTHTGYSESKSLDHVNNGEEANNQKTYENDLVNNENNMGESVPNSKNEHVSNRIIESGDARDGNNGNEFADDGKNRDSFVKNENKDDDFVNHDVHGDTAFIERENNRNIAHYKEKPAPGNTQINGTERFPWKPFKAEGVDCFKLFAGDESELQLAKDIQPPAYNTTDLIRDASGCSDFVAQNGFYYKPTDDDGERFPHCVQYFGL
ncbi:hypothetical protein V1264_004974 [Littorina saxatilis]|uniref:Uncharacterized protein n=1 Tax=Littorina saxatilis TaxID=31220 RepID=A0AAN9B2P2_9CAEN